MAGGPKRKRKMKRKIQAIEFVYHSPFRQDVVLYLYSPAEGEMEILGSQAKVDVRLIEGEIQGDIAEIRNIFGPLDLFLASKTWIRKERGVNAELLEPIDCRPGQIKLSIYLEE